MTIAADDLQGRTVECPACKAPVRETAKFCRHCGVAMLPAVPSEQNSSAELSTPEGYAEPSPMMPTKVGVKNWRHELKRRRNLAAGALVVVVVACGYLVFLKWPNESAAPIPLAPQISTTAPSLPTVPAPELQPAEAWAGAPGAESCPTQHCLQALMEGSGASRAAISLATRLTAARSGHPAWPVNVTPYNQVRYIEYRCFRCRAGGFAFLGGNSALILDKSIFNDLDAWFSADTSMSSAHPDAQLVSGMHLRTVEPKATGGQSFRFVTNVADCQRCTPYSGVELAFNFDESGRYMGKTIIGEVTPIQ